MNTTPRPRRADMTPEQLAKERDRDRRRQRASRAKPDARPTARLDEQGRMELAYLSWMGLWSRASLAKAFGVTPKTAWDCQYRRHPRRTA